MTATGDNLLHYIERFAAYHRQVPAGVFFVTPRIADDASIKGIAEYMVYGLVGEWCIVACPKSPARQQAQNLRLGIGSGSEFVPPLLQDAECGLVGLVGLGFLAAGCVLPL